MDLKNKINIQSSTGTRRRSNFTRGLDEARQAHIRPASSKRIQLDSCKALLGGCARALKHLLCIKIVQQQQVKPHPIAEFSA